MNSFGSTHIDSTVLVSVKHSFQEEEKSLMKALNTARTYFYEEHISDMLLLPLAG